MEVLFEDSVIDETAISNNESVTKEGTPVPILEALTVPYEVVGDADLNNNGSK